MFAFCKPAYCSLSASLLLANICRNRDVFRIHSVIRGEQEAESVRIRTPDYVVLPDTEKLNRHWRSMYVC